MELNSNTPDEVVNQVQEDKPKKAQERAISERAKRTALALAFGVVIQGGFVTGIPGGVPGLSRALTCGNCVMKLNRGVPTQFAAIMTKEQKDTFRKATKKGGK